MIVKEAKLEQLVMRRTDWDEQMVIKGQKEVKVKYEDLAESKWRQMPLVLVWL